MNQFIPLLVGVFALALGSILGYYARQSIAKRDWKTIEAKLQKRIFKAREESEKLLQEAKAKASNLIAAVKKEEDQRRTELLKTEQLLLRRENIANH